MSSRYCETGWSRHQHFGLRREWLDLYLAEPHGWRASPMLGCRQVQSLTAWLRTACVESTERRPTPLGEQFAARGLGCRSLWELLWTNVVFNFPTALWYVRLGKGEWTTTELRSLLRATVSRLAERTASNAIMELAGLLERTPIGDELGQGQVVASRPRRIVRRGSMPCDAAIVHSLGRLYLQQGHPRLLWESDLTWPWVVFGCDRQSVLGRLTLIDEQYLDIDEQGVTIRAQDRGRWQCGGIAISLL